MHSRWIQSGFEVDPGWIRGDFEAPRRTAWAIRAPGAPPGARPGPNLESDRGVPRECPGSPGVWHDGAPAHYLVSLGGGGAAGAPKGAEGLQPASAGVSRDVTRAQRPGSICARGAAWAPWGAEGLQPASASVSRDVTRAQRLGSICARGAALRGEFELNSN